MTDRVHSLTVVLEKDVRTDDVEALISAIRQLRGVISVKQHIADPESHMAMERARNDLRDQIAKILWPA